MKLKLKDNPKEWRKNALLSALGVAILTTVLHWRRVLPTKPWFVILGVMVLVAVGAILQPKWFRGYYRVCARIGFCVSQFLGHILFSGFFFVVLTPLAIIFRLSGKDSLRLKKPDNASSYWSTPRENNSLERPF